MTELRSEQRPNASPIDAMFGLHGLVAVITGGNRGIGRGISLAMAAAGATIVVASRSAEGAAGVIEEIRLAGGKASHVLLEVGDEASVIQSIAAAHAQHRAIDILVNNAGIFPATPLLETSGDDWDDMFRVNMRGPFLCLREAARRMIEDNRGGRIVNISSMGSQLPAAPSRTAYNASKAALNRLTQDAAAALAKNGILVNALLPGPTDTVGAGTRDEPALKLHDAIARRIPLQRWGAPADIARAAVFLAGPGASFITGQCLLVDGGFTLGTQR